MTAAAMSDDREQFTKAGVDQYITKPFNAETVSRLLDSIV
jgi:CheY-like chemotaxis protein